MTFLKPSFKKVNRKDAKVSAQNARVRLGFFPLRLCGLLLILLFTNSRPRTLHDFHASVTQMQYNVKEQVFEISIRIFTDDFEKVLSAESNSKVNLNGNDKNDALIEKYIHAHFTYINPQKQAQPIKYVGHDIEADANWLYLEMPYTEPFRGGHLKQNVLMEYFDDQVNMVNIQYQNQKKTFVFRKSQPVQDISL